MVEELQEEKRMNAAFSHISETGSNDAALMWQGRNRFLAEQVKPVVIKPVPEKSYPAPDGGTHRIIDGDNLAVMRSLLTEFRGGPKTGFDVVYIDPPYNTGKDSFIYNDNYRFSKAEVERMKLAIYRVEKGVSLDDPSRHTKWINHMAPRLWAARKLLKYTGVIIVSIDEHELPRLWLLMEEMFGEKNRDEVKRERYRVRTYQNALHAEYNGLNPFEAKLADALDTLNMDWCRNPSKTGYGIPIPEVGEGTTNFYSDFLLWSGKCLWAIDPKGKHLLSDAIRTKLMGVSDVDDMPLKIRVAFVVEGKWELGADHRPEQVGKDGCTLIVKQNTGPRAKYFDSV